MGSQLTKMVLFNQVLVNHTSPFSIKGLKSNRTWILPRCDHEASHTWHHFGRSEFTHYKIGSCSIIQLFSWPKVSKSHRMIFFCAAAKGVTCWFWTWSLQIFLNFCKQLFRDSHLKIVVSHLALKKVSHLNTAVTTLSWNCIPASFELRTSSWAPEADIAMLLCLRAKNNKRFKTFRKTFISSHWENNIFVCFIWTIRKKFTALLGRSKICMAGSVSTFLLLEMIFRWHHRLRSVTTRRAGLGSGETNWSELNSQGTFKSHCAVCFFFQVGKRWVYQHRRSCLFDPSCIAMSECTAHFKWVKVSSKLGCVWFLQFLALTEFHWINGIVKKQWRLWWSTTKLPNVQFTSLQILRSRSAPNPTHINLPYLESRSIDSIRTEPLIHWTSKTCVWSLERFHWPTGGASELARGIKTKEPAALIQTDCAVCILPDLLRDDANSFLAWPAFSLELVMWKGTPGDSVDGASFSWKAPLHDRSVWTRSGPEASVPGVRYLRLYLTFWVLLWGSWTERRAQPGRVVVRSYTRECPGCSPSVGRSTGFRTEGCSLQNINDKFSESPGLTRLHPFLCFVIPISQKTAQDPFGGSEWRVFNSHLCLLHHHQQQRVRTSL